MIPLLMLITFIQPVSVEEENTVVIDFSNHFWKVEVMEHYEDCPCGRDKRYKDENAYQDTK